MADPRKLAFYCTLSRFEQAVGARMVLQVILGNSEWSSASKFEHENAAYEE